MTELPRTPESIADAIVTQSKNLEAAKQALQEATPETFIQALINFFTRAESLALRRLELAQQNYDASHQDALDNMEMIHDEAEKYVDLFKNRYERVYDVLASVFERVDGAIDEKYWQVGHGSVSSFINDIGSIKSELTSLTEEECADVIALLDILKPRMYSEGYAGASLIIGGNEIGYNNGVRFPRVSLGYESEEEARSENKGDGTILKISISGTGRFGRASQAERFVPITSDVAELVAKGKSALDINSSLSKAFGPDWGSNAGSIEVTYNVLPNDPE